MPMRRSDRKDSNDDNAINHLRSRQKEPASPHELKQLLMTARAQRDEWQQKAKENEAATTQLVQVQQEIQTYQVKFTKLEEGVAQNYQLYIGEQQNHQQTLCLYNEEKGRVSELLSKYEEANSQKERYLALYNETKAELKYERRSKASIKGWETRRKAENERLKREIADMVVLLQESMSSKDEAVNNLYVVAERLDRIQSLVDSVEEETTNNPLGLVQKFKRIWLAIKEILSE
ncbi:MAG: hypothetical protein KME32_34965 [Mojavia pulchra JT2-VF2]|jgi:chromosome segregation ATPase|uniref:Uncharacterized protein n=1 Tax=Mojavia pulchra JT2-VF2 TaxID=287848 RepID=A0A951Q5L9_9NOST|nr:hypothetical protein [Mojavia pulchra JT2-VF2]